MAVDVHIGSVETVIEAGEGSGAGGADRQRLIAEILRAVRAEMARDVAEAALRAHDTARAPAALARGTDPCPR